MSTELNWRPVDDLHPGTLLIPIGRVSHRSQKDHLPAIRADLLNDARTRRLKVVAKFAGVENAQDENRHGLQKILKAARELNATLYAPNIDRFIRPLDNPKGHPGPDDIARLARVAKGVRFATKQRSLDEHGTSEHAKRGQAASGNYGGRPKAEHPKKTRRLKLEPEAIRLHKKGWGYDRIGEELGVPKQTVASWLRKKSYGGNGQTKD